MKSKHGAQECGCCLRPPLSDEVFSYTGLCLDCAQGLLTSNIYGLVEPDSPEYKRHALAIRARGRSAPRLCTPPPGWTPAK